MPNNRPFKDFVPRISTIATGCPTPTIIMHAREAAIRVCNRSLFWRRELSRIRLLPGIPEYAYPVPLGSEVAAVFRVLTDDCPLQVMTLEQAIEHYPGWVDLFSGQSPDVAWSQTSPNPWNAEEFNANQLNDSNPYDLVPSIIEKAGQPRTVCQLSPHRFIVLPLPDDKAPYSTRIFAALRPTRTATEIPAHLFDEIEDAVFHEALHHLMAIPGRVWSSQNQAGYHRRMAKETIQALRARANLGNHRGTMVARGTPFV